MKRLFVLISTLLLFAAFVTAPAFAGEEKTADQPVKADTAAPKVKAVKKTEAPKMVTTPSGVRYEDIKVGTGKTAVDSMKVECHYTLWLADSTGLVQTKKVQSSKDRGQPMPCQLGVALIQGWTEGMIGMKEGGVRIIYVPYRLGYGEAGKAPLVPGKTNLIFEIEFVKAL